MSRLGEVNRGSPKIFATKGRPGYWHELKSHIYGLREMDGYGNTEKEMKKVNYQEMDVIPWPLLVGVHGGAPSVQRYPPQVQASAESDQVICIRMS
ncbi:hypothetical protein DEO72_LG8g1871 [Vigna unguiculata]|uniref:Uncharacterized protein n=1 Tax=Vigna unguiculata TaxID=3917 RepID=A0A4D6MT86_VIGUN|nr:hypothetical protein DEO72_LG8g1871 [Vigna unguiculata]